MFSSHECTTYYVVTPFQQQFQAQLQESQQRVIQLQQAVQQNQLAHQQQMANLQQNVGNQGVGQQNVANQGVGQQNVANQGVAQQNIANQAMGQPINSANQGVGRNHVLQNQNFNQIGQNLPPNNQQRDVALKFLDQQSLVCIPHCSSFKPSLNTDIKKTNNKLN